MIKRADCRSEKVEPVTWKGFSLKSNIL